MTMLDSSTRVDSYTEKTLNGNKTGITVLRNTTIPRTNNYALIPLNSIVSTSIKKENIQKKRSIWEIDGRLRCPVIGNCLSFSEQKKILKKADIAINILSDFEIHTTLTQSISEESPLSVRIQHYLNKKYRKNILEAGLYSESKFFSLWKKGLITGEIDGLLWVAVIKISLSEAGINRLFGDIHMLMHEQGSIVKRGLLQITNLKKENGKLKGKLQSIQKGAHEISCNLNLLNNKLAVSEKNIIRLTEDNRKLKNKTPYQTEKHLKKEIEKLNIKLEKQRQKLKTQEHIINSEKAVNSKLESELKSQKKTIPLASNRVDLEFPKPLGTKTDCTNCSVNDLCARKVLLVGGLTRLRPFYQKIVESTGGEFKHHDGHNGGSKHRLENWVDWADVVLCPVDVNSHSACLNVKRTCKKLEKNYQMLPSSSVSSISRALEMAE